MDDENQVEISSMVVLIKAVLQVKNRWPRVGKAWYRQYIGKYKRPTGSGRSHVDSLDTEQETGQSEFEELATEKVQATTLKIFRR